MMLIQSGVSAGKRNVLTLGSMPCQVCQGFECKCVHGSESVIDFIVKSSGCP